MKSQIPGNPNMNNSLALCISFLLKYLNQQESAGYISGLLGTAFTPIFNPEEDCTAWWMEGGDDIRAEFTLNALGFRCERISSELTIGDIINKTESLDKHISRLREFASEGHTIIHNTWPLWSIITGWNDMKNDFEVNSFKGFPQFISPGDLFVIYEINQPINAETFIEDALSYGTRIAVGDVNGGKYIYGGELYRTASDKNREDVFCVPCSNQERHSDAGCMNRTLARMIGTVSEFVGFVSVIRSRFNIDDQHLNQAYNNAKQIASILMPRIKDSDIAQEWGSRKMRDELSDDLMRCYDLHREFSSSLLN